MARSEAEKEITFGGEVVEILKTTKEGRYVARTTEQVSESCSILDASNNLVGPAMHPENLGRVKMVRTELEPGQKYAELVLNGDSRLVIQGDNGVVQWLKNLPLVRNFTK